MAIMKRCTECNCLMFFTKESLCNSCRIELKRKENLVALRKNLKSEMQLKRHIAPPTTEYVRPNKTTVRPEHTTQSHYVSQANISDDLFGAVLATEIISAAMDSSTSYDSSSSYTPCDTSSSSSYYDSSSSCSSSYDSCSSYSSDSSSYSSFDSGSCSSDSNSW